MSHSCIETRAALHAALDARLPNPAEGLDLANCADCRAFAAFARCLNQPQPIVTQPMPRLPMPRFTEQIQPRRWSRVFAAIASLTAPVAVAFILDIPTSPPVVVPVAPVAIVHAEPNWDEAYATARTRILPAAQQRLNDSARISREWIEAVDLEPVTSVAHVTNFEPVREMGSQAMRQVLPITRTAETMYHNVRESTIAEWERATRVD